MKPTFFFIKKIFYYYFVPVLSLA